MIFGDTITNGLLQVAVSAGESTIRHACSGAEVDLHSELEQFADGRDAIRVYVRGPGWETDFTMLLRNYFIRAVLWRVARRAWQKRASADVTAPRILDFEMIAWNVGMN